MSAGTHVGPYTIERAVGRPGGQGSVYLARNADGYQFALKIPHEVSPRFIRELDAARAVVSPFVARVWDFDLQHEPPYIAYDAVPGRPLDEVVSERELAPEEVIKIFRQVARGLADIHSVTTAEMPQLSHGDLSPDNILVTPRNDAVVIDLGAAKTGNDSSLSRDLFGKFGYFAPEQLEGSASGPAADVWQFAVCFLRVVTGRMPFGSGPESMMRILEEPPNAVDTPDQLLSPILGCLRKEPSKRPAATHVAALLESLEDSSRLLRSDQLYRRKVMRVNALDFRVRADGLIERQADLGASALGRFSLSCGPEICVGDQVVLALRGLRAPVELQHPSRTPVACPNSCPECGRALTTLRGNWREPPYGPNHTRYRGHVEQWFCPYTEACAAQSSAYLRRFVLALGGIGTDPELRKRLYAEPSPLEALGLRAADFDGDEGLWLTYQEWRGAAVVEAARDVSGLCASLGAPGAVFGCGLGDMLRTRVPWPQGVEPLQAERAWWEERGPYVLACAEALSTG